jgi:hypothetical protein
MGALGPTFISSWALAIPRRSPAWKRTLASLKVLKICCKKEREGKRKERKEERERERERKKKKERKKERREEGGRKERKDGFLSLTDPNFTAKHALDGRVRKQNLPVQTIVSRTLESGTPTFSNCVHVW